MLKRDPEGYRKLLAYQKACELQVFTNEFVTHLPKTKTFFDLADQMARSGRSGSKNIVEGWKRNTTKEYFEFLGFSIGAVEELKDDAADICTGVYPNLMGIKGVMGSKRVEGEVMGEQKGLKEERGEMGEKGNPLSPLDPLIPSNPLHPSNPLPPFSSSASLIQLPISRAELDKLKFYPLDPNSPPALELFLRAKEVNYLLYKLQQSLDVKMDEEKTKPANQRYKNYFDQQKQADKDTEKYFADLGLLRLENGQYVTKEEWEAKGKPPLFPSRP